MAEIFYPPQNEIDAAPKITLGAAVYPICQLALQQNKAAWPLIFKLNLVFRPPDGSPFNPVALTPEVMNDLINLLWVGISRANPLIKLENVLALSPTLPQLITAMRVIATQAGLVETEAGSAGQGRRGGSNAAAVDIEAIVTRIITITGWTRDYTLNAVTMEIYGNMCRYWNEHPPLHELVAAYLGVGKTSKPMSGVEAFVGMAPKGIYNISDTN